MIYNSTIFGITSTHRSYIAAFLTVTKIVIITEVVTGTVRSTILRV